MRDLLKTCYGITDAALAEDLVKAGKLETFPKGSIIVEAGKEQHYVPILLEGVTRGYLIDADGTDITDCFSYRRGDILLGCTQLASPSYVNIEAITAVKCITIIAEEFGGKKLPRKGEKNLEKDRGERGFN